MGDWGSIQYIISQVFIILSFVLFTLTYFMKKRNIILLSCILGNLLMGIGYSLLYAWVGVCMCIVAIFRDSVSAAINKKRSPEDKNKITKLDWILLAVWVVALVVPTVLTEEGFLTWFALFGTMAFTVSVWQKNILVYKILGVASAICWVVYNIAVKNFFGLILEACLLVGVIIGLVLYLTKSKKKVPLPEDTSKAIAN